MSPGYIKLYRDLILSPIFEELSIQEKWDAIIMMSRASYKQEEKLIGERRIPLAPG